MVKSKHVPAGVLRRERRGHAWVWDKHVKQVHTAVLANILVIEVKVEGQHVGQVLSHGRFQGKYPGS